MIKVSQSEYVLMRKFIEEQCGISLEKDKEYLIESRLTDLVIENSCNSFMEFHSKARSDLSGNLKDRIVDAMTTNETLWFRDNSTWNYIKEVAVPQLLDKAEKGENVRIWSAAASTGQEAYSLLILLHEAASTRGKLYLLNQIEILGTDISSSAISLARSARYNSLAMNRGMPVGKKQKYFSQNGNVWAFDHELKRRVMFKQFNLKNSFVSLGKFDLILCRYVAIYFSTEFKKALFLKISEALKPGSVFLLGASESIRGFSDDFKISYYKDAVINEKPFP